MSSTSGKISLRVVIASAAALGSLGSVAGRAMAEEGGKPSNPSGQSSGATQGTAGPSTADSRAGNGSSDHVLSPAPHPAAPALQPVPLIPDPVKLGGFHPKPDPAPSVFLQEGNFVYDRPARFQIEADGRAALQFNADAKPGAAKPPLVYVLPNLKRMAIEDALKGRSMPLIVSGTVTDFDGHNYLLLDDNTRPAGSPAAAPAAVGQGAQPAAPATRPATPAKNLSSEQLLGQLLRSTPGSAAPSSGSSPGSSTASDGSSSAPLRSEKPIETDRTSGGGAVKPGAPQVTLIREGHYITDRLGRLSRGSNGKAADGKPDGKPVEFVLDADGRALRDPPLIVMPCSKLLFMQSIVAAIGGNVRFRVSGTVTEYRGRNYLLPEKVVIMPDAVQSF